MIENGLLKEAETAYKRKAGGAFQSIGHKELFGYFEGIFTLDEAVENLKRQTRRYAKRQLTWFRRDQRINWIYADQTDNVLQTAKEIIENYLD
jgi:tRNA dimethylallyltransferase